MGGMTTTANNQVKVGDRVLIFNRNPQKAWRSGIVLSMQDGYVTVEHLRVLEELGPCPEHRRSFRCVPEPGQLQVEGE